MALNIHPIFVHIPIAFWAIYALFEIVHVEKLQKKEWWVVTKFVMLVVGLLGAFASLQTGEMAEHAFRGTPSRQLIEVHSFFASLTTVFFGIITLLYLGHLVREHINNKNIRKVADIIDLFYEKIIGSWAAVAVGIVGFALIVIVGALGGAIVYGPDVEPITQFVYNLFF